MTADRPLLLPTGLADLLPPAAAHEASSVERLIAFCRQQGYERVKPPLLEFETSLLAGAGGALARQTFRLMDPDSREMLGLRADMTPQVVRIAGSRLAGEPRPLRLCYAGQVLRLRGGHMRPERQFGQVGAELIGSDALAADVEIVLLAAAALRHLGIEQLTLDLSLPSVVPELIAAKAIPEEAQPALREALDRKDIAAVLNLAGEHGSIFGELLRAAGPVEAAIGRLRALPLNGPSEETIGRLSELATQVKDAEPSLSITVDPVEHRGQAYQQGLSFTFFARGVRGELGRGGRYLAESGSWLSEPATGFTLYTDSVLRAAPSAAPRPRLFMPLGAPLREARRLREEGWITLGGLAPVADPAAEARRLNCSHLWRDGAIEEL